MSTAKGPHYLKYLALTAGILGALLRVAVYLVGTDAKGLPIRGHWSQTGLYLLTGISLLFFLWRSRKLPQPVRYADACPRSALRAAGCLVAAFAFLVADTPNTMGPAFAAAERILRWIAVISMVAVACCRFTGRRSLFLFHGAVSLFLTLRMVGLYRLWSADPQLIDYVFYLGAYIALVLSAYHLAAFDAGAGSHRKLWFWGLTAIYLCGVSLSGNQEPLFLLLCLVWILTNLSCLHMPLPETAAPEAEV